MSTTSPLLIKRGTPVRTTKADASSSGGWSDAALADRKWDMQGVVTDHSDSHGLCYEIMHEDGTVGWYDPSEFEVLQ